MAVDVAPNQNTPIKTSLENTDFEVASLDHGRSEYMKNETIKGMVKYFFVGLLFGIILVKSEVISWFRIQEMFRLQSFHMYGVLGSAVVVGMISVMMIKKFNIKTIHGDTIVFPKKKFNKGNIIGGLIFGFGWAITGACPGPLFAQIGGGATVIIVTLLAAIFGTWVYGLIRHKLPH